MFKIVTNGMETRIVNMVRKIEKLSHRIASYRNHRTFMIKCRNYDITPNYLRLKSTLRTYVAQNILVKAEKSLVKENIRLICSKINFMIDERKSLVNDFMSLITDKEKIRLLNTFINDTEIRMFEKCKERQISKFQKLLSKKKESSAKTNNNWVLNSSNYQLDANEISLLKKGLNFSITPKTTPYKEFIIATEKATKGMEENSALALRSDVRNILLHSKLPKDNLSKGERMAMNKLKKNKEIIIVPADKGRITVVMNRIDYSNKINNLLADAGVYKILNNDPTNKYKAQLLLALKKLKKEGKLNEDTYKFLYPTAEICPRLYGLPKVHKEGMPVRPIVDSTASISYNISKHLANILSPLLNQSGFSLKNTFDLVKQLKGWWVKDDEILISHDVVSLFTNVPIKEAINTIRRKLNLDRLLPTRTNLTISDICNLLDLVLNITYFTFEGKFYQQCFGTAMGSPVSPIVANLYMEFLEERLHSTAPLNIVPRFWRRYVDDIIEIVKRDKVDVLTEYLNKLDPTEKIKFTLEKEENATLPFLDILIKKEIGGRLNLNVYRKHTHTDQYLQFDSHHPLIHKSSVLRSLLNRCNTIITNEDDRVKEIDHIRGTLNNCGYPNWFLKREQRMNRKTNVNTRPREIKEKKLQIILPYVEGISQKIDKVFRRHGRTAIFKPMRTLRSSLIQVKDPIPPYEQCGCVYEVTCQNCEKSYVGETGRKLKTRIAEHRKATEQHRVGTMTRNRSKEAAEIISCSAIADHSLHEDHIINWKGVNVIAVESDPTTRLIRESVEIRQRDTFNRDEGSFQLSHIWDDLIKN